MFLLIILSNGQQSASFFSEMLPPTVPVRLKRIPTDEAPERVIYQILFEQLAKHLFSRLNGKMKAASGV